MNRTFRFALAAAAAMMSAAAAAQAQDYQTRHVTVAYDDLNLSTDAGRAALDARIDSATIKACGGYPSFNPAYHDAPVFFDKAFAKCRAAARQDAVTSLYRKGVRVAAKGR